MSGNPFALTQTDPNDPYGGISSMLSGMFSGTGGSGGSGGFDAGPDLDTQLKQAQLDGFTKQNAAFDRLGQPQSGWATGAQTFGSIAQGIAGLGNIYLGLQGLKQQKEAFKFNKGVVNTNLNNSIMDYNRRLHDTLVNRSLNNGQGDAYVSSQMSQWQAKRS